MGSSVSSAAAIDEVLKDATHQRVQNLLSKSEQDNHRELAADVSVLAQQQRDHLRSVQLTWLLDTPAVDLLEGFETEETYSLLQAKLWELFVLARARRLKKSSSESGMKPEPERARVLCKEAVEAQEQSGLAGWTPEERVKLVQRSGKSYSLARELDQQEVERNCKRAVCLLGSECASMAQHAQSQIDRLRESAGVKLPSNSATAGLNQHELIKLVRMADQNSAEGALTSAKALHAMAQRFVGQHRSEMAEPLLHRSLELHRTQLGVCHPDTFDVAATLVKVQSSQGQNELAIALLKKLDPQFRGNDAPGDVARVQQTAVRSMSPERRSSPQHVSTARRPSSLDTVRTGGEVRVEYSPSRSTSPTPSKATDRPHTAIPAGIENSSPVRPGRNRPLTAVSPVSGSLREVGVKSQKPGRRHSTMSASSMLPVLGPIRAASTRRGSNATMQAEDNLEAQRRVEQLEVLANNLADELHSTDLELQETQMRLAAYEETAQDTGPAIPG